MTRAIASTTALVALATLMICTAPATAATAGALSPLPGADACIGQSPCPWGRGILDGVSDLAVTPDGTNVYAASTNGLAVFRRDASTGKLTLLEGNAGCFGFPEASGGDRRGGSSQAAGPCGSARALGYGGARSIAVSPDGRSVYVGSQIVGDFDVVPTLVVFSRDPSTGALTQLPGTQGCIVPPDTQDGNPGCATVQYPPGRMVVSPDGKHVYGVAGTRDLSTSWIRTYARAADGSITETPNCVGRSGAGGCASAGSSFEATELKLAPAGDLLYAGGDTLTSLRRNADGTLAPTGNCLSRRDEACAAYRTLGGAATFDVSPDGRHLYAAGATTRRVVLGGIAVDPASGALAQLTGADTCVTNNAEGGGCIVDADVDELNNPLVSPDGENVYAKMRGGIVSLERKSSGAIAPLGGIAGCVTAESGTACTQVLLADANALSASPDGRHVYAGGTSGVSAFERAPGLKLPGTGATLSSLQAQVSGAQVRIPVECRSDKRCKGAIRILARGGAKAAAARRVVLGSGTYSIAPGRRAKVKAKLTARGRALVRRAKRTKAIVETTSKVAGRTVTNRATVTLRR